MSVKTNLQSLISRYNQLVLSHPSKGEEIGSLDSCLVASPTSADDTTSRVNHLLRSHFQNTRGDFRKATVFFVMQSDSSSELLQKKYITDLIELVSRENDIVLQPLYDKENLETEFLKIGLSFSSNLFDLVDDYIDLTSKNLVVRGWVDRSLYHISLDDLYLEDSQLWKECIRLSKKVALAIGVQVKNISELPRIERIKELMKLVRQALDYTKPDLESNFMSDHNKMIILNDNEKLIASMQKVTEIQEINVAIIKVMLQKLGKTKDSFPGKRIFVIAPSFCLDTIVGRLNSEIFFSTEYKVVETKSKL